jgi:betaine reductase
LGKKLRVVHYINQFFGQMGGERRAGIPPQMKEGPIGPGVILQEMLGDRGEVVATIICGDNYFSNDADKATEELLRLIKSKSPAILIAGPAFNAGRYGIACGEVCRRVSKELGIPCVAGMYRENPGVGMYRRSVYIIETPCSVLGMKDALSKMVEFAIKLSEKKTIGTPGEEEYFQRGIRKNIFSEKLASERVVDMLMAKLSGNPFVTEVSDPIGAKIEPASPLEEILSAKIALVTEGGLVPKGNPDRIEGARCTKFARYPIWPKNSLPAEQFECIHRGFDSSSINEDPNRLLPIDVLADMEKKGQIGKLFPFFYSTCGCGTYIGEARRIGKEITKSLKVDGVQGVILVAT